MVPLRMPGPSLGIDTHRVTCVPGRLLPACWSQQKLSLSILLSQVRFLAKYGRCCMAPT